MRREYGLGRREAPDSRDRDFPMRAVPRLLDEPMQHFRYHYANGWWGNQGNYPHCVAYAWLHWLEDGPITQPITPHGHPVSVLPPLPFYNRCQENDEWPGTNYDGTSVRAGAKVAQEEGFIESYYWGFDALTVFRAILNGFPVVMGTWWRENMWETDEEGMVRYSGAYEGGHAWEANGGWIPRGLTIRQALQQDVGYIRGKNSWGRGWGHNGHFYMSLKDFDAAIREDGEACIATEIRKL